MPMPRVISGTAPSAGVFNTLAAEVDSLGAGCKVLRTSTATLVNNTDLLIAWQALEYDTGGGMWDIANSGVITCRQAGVYSVTLQVRFGATSAVGQRAIKILLNGTSVFTNAQASDKRAASNSGEGTTCSATAMVRMGVGDLLFASAWQNSASSITALYQDFGNTFMTVNRMGPLVG